jgi:hypothetical protein
MIASDLPVSHFPVGSHHGAASHAVAGDVDTSGLTTKRTSPIRSSAVPGRAQVLNGSSGAIESGNEPHDVPPRVSSVADIAQTLTWHPLPAAKVQRQACS